MKRFGIILTLLAVMFIIYFSCDKGKNKTVETLEITDTLVVNETIDSTEVIEIVDTLNIN